MKKIIFALSLAVTVFSCKKEVVGPTGPQGEQGIKGDQGNQGEQGPGATTKKFNLTFNAGDTFKSYSPGFSNFGINDIMLVYIYSDTYGTSDYYIQLPTILLGAVNVYPEISAGGHLFINTAKADGSSGSPWVSSVNLGFKAVHIKSSTIALHPEIDWENKDQVADFVKEKQL